MRPSIWPGNAWATDSRTSFWQPVWGELYHLNGEPEKALELWQRTVEMNEKSLQAYRYVGDFMRNRREFAAPSIYTKQPEPVLATLPCFLQK